MKRELGSFERALVASDRYAPFHSVYILQLESPPPSQIIGKALKFLQKRHPFLRARILPEDGKYYFASLVEPVIPFRVLPRWNDMHWVKVVEVELEAQSESSPGPMFRCTYLYDENQKQAEIILTFFHSLVDAASAGCLMHELLMACASLMDEGTVTASELAPAPPQESRFPPAFRGGGLTLRTFGYVFRQIADEIIYQIQTRDKRKPPLHKKPSHGQIISLELPDTFTATLLHRTDLEKVTLHAILHAALMVAVNRHLYAGKRVPMRTISAWDMRPSVEPPLPNEHLGNYISPLRHSVLVEGGSNVWQLARLLQQKLSRSLQAGEHFTAAAATESLLKLATSMRSFRLSSTSLSFSGESRLKANYGEMIVNDLHGYISACDIGPEFLGQARLFNRRMILDFTYLDADMTYDEAKAIVEEIKSILHAAVTSPLFSI
jgi:hypothetical protein